MQSTEGSDAAVANPGRRYDIDWLRLTAVFLLFLFHSARIFDIRENFYVQNSSLSHVISDIFVRSLNPWHMSLFFLLAGASTYYALRHRSGGQYVRERFKRLFVPFIFGLLVLIPPQSYVGLLSHSGYSGSFLQWFPQFFILKPDDMDGYFLGGHTWGHLWFIIHLFAYCMIALPFLLWVNRESGQRLIGNLAAGFAFPGVLFFVPLPLALIRRFPDIAGGNPLFYMAFFIVGYVFMSHPRFAEIVDRRRVILLFLGPVLFAVLLAAGSSEDLTANLPVWVGTIVEIYIAGFVPWFVILALLAYGKRLLNFSSALLKYFAEASYPLYILHQTVIVIIGYYVVQADIAVAVKYVIIVACSFAGSLMVYDILVRRSNVTRLLFGMKPRVKRVRSNHR